MEKEKGGIMATTSAIERTTCVRMDYIRTNFLDVFMHCYGPLELGVLLLLLGVGERNTYIAEAMERID